MDMSRAWRTIKPSEPESWHIVKRLGLVDPKPSVPVHDTMSSPITPKFGQS